MTTRSSRSSSSSLHPFGIPAGLLTLGLLISPTDARAQSSADAAAAGMSEYFEGTTDPKQAELMRVRAAAQRERSTAQQAAVARTANQAWEERQRDLAIENARINRELKERAARAAAQQRAANAYQAVGADELGGDIRPGLPSDFVAQLSEIEPDEEEEKSGGALGAMKRALSWRPNLRLPFSGKSDEEKAAEAAANPAAIQLSSFTPPGQLGLNVAPSGSISQPQVTTTAPPTQSITTDPSQYRPVPAEELEPDFGAPAPAEAPKPLLEGNDSDGGGFFARLNPFKGGSTEGSDGSDDFASTPPPPAASPDGRTPLVGRDAAQNPLPQSGQGAQNALFGPVNAHSPDGDPAYADTSSSRQASDEGSGSGFFSKLNPLKLVGDRDKRSADATASTTSSPSAQEMSAPIYIVRGGSAWLHVFSGPGSSKGRAMTLAPGTVVRMTKPGKEWCAVQLKSGEQGTIQVDKLRRAQVGEVSSTAFAHLDKPSYPSTARISRRLSAADTPTTPPANAPTPSLPEGEQGSVRIGNGLLPPVNPDQVP